MAVLQSAAPASLLVLATWLTFCVSESLRPSEGCKKLSTVPARSLDAGLQKLQKKEIMVADFEEVKRDYWVQAPRNAATPAPVLFSFHGQSGNASLYAASHNFNTLGEAQNLMTVFPQGVNDSPDADHDQGTGWNCGTAGDDSTCVSEGVGSEGACYKSCQKLKKCGKCNWSTCYDDVLFVKTVLAHVAKEFCIDLDRVYSDGESNGAMFTQHLVRELPDVFAGVSTWFGTPLTGYLLGKRLEVIAGQPQLARTAYLSLHGRNDTCIPPQGGEDDGGWLYEPLAQSTGIWAGIHRCDTKATHLPTPWDGGTLNFQCAEYRRCSTGRRVVQCMYDGVHGDWPTGHDGDQITVWFLLQFSRGSPVAPAAEATEYDVTV